MICQADAVRLPFADKTFDLVIGSPPYLEARTYLEDGKDLGIARDCRDWVTWMLDVTAEALRVSKGLVIWVCAGVTRDRNYQPGPEGLLWEWWKQGGECHCLRPVYWHRVGIPGSGGDQWFRADVEYCLAFKRPGKLPWSDNTANGHKPKWPSGGKLPYRDKEGKRRHMQRGTSGYKDGDAVYHKLLDRAVTEIANPGNLIHSNNGGGQLGSSLAHANEAPYPVDVPAWFIVSHCPPGGAVLDPFSGSGTTIDAALSLGRKGYGCDLRFSQCKLTRKRVRTVTPGFVFKEAQ
jgi:site-specific DNA-methyltransferase (cytosine-N4-specific)